MSVTTTRSDRAETIFLFRFDEIVDGPHGRTHVHSSPVNVTLTLPKGMVRIAVYDYKDSKAVEFAVAETDSIIALLSAARDRYNEQLLQVRPAPEQPHPKDI